MQSEMNLVIDHVGPHIFTIHVFGNFTKGKEKNYIGFEYLVSWVKSQGMLALVLPCSPAIGHTNGLI